MSTNTNTREASTIAWELRFKREALANAELTLTRSPYWEVREATACRDFLARAVAGLEAELAQA